MCPPADGGIVVANAVLEQTSGTIPEATREPPGVVDARLLLLAVDVAQRIIPIRVHRVATAIGHLHNRAFPVKEVVVLAPTRRALVVEQATTTAHELRRAPTRLDRGEAKAGVDFAVPVDRDAILLTGAVSLR